MTQKVLVVLAGALTVAAILLLAWGAWILLAKFGLWGLSVIWADAPQSWTAAAKVGAVLAVASALFSHGRSSKA